MNLRSYVDRVPERQATRGDFIRAALWLSFWLAAMAAPLTARAGGWELWSFAAIGWVRIVPLATALAALFGRAGWALLATSVVYALYWAYLMYALRTWGGT